MRWRALAQLIRGNPGRMLVISLLLLVPPAAAAGKAKLSYNVLRELPASSDSVRGYTALQGHFD
ncbi:MAG: hypothetical protein ACRDJM_05535, partial [Actinomycetota bacterium]